MMESGQARYGTWNVETRAALEREPLFASLVLEIDIEIQLFPNSMNFLPLFMFA